MSKLKIYVNSMNEIRALHATDDKTLREYIIPREEYFGSHTDAYILGYTYEELKDENGNVTGVICAPYVDKHYLEIVESLVIQIYGDRRIAINHSTLDEVIKFHKKAVGLTAQTLIERGFDLGKNHYSLTSYDQQMISGLYGKVAYGGQKYVAWHPDGGDCRLISAEEMIQIGRMAEAYITFHTTRMNIINGMIKKCKTKKEVLAINYRTILDDEGNSKLDNILNPLGITGDIRAYCEASIAAADDPEGEYYTNAASMIDPQVYDTEKFADVAAATVATDPKTKISTFKIPTTFVDRDRIGDGIANSTTLSPTFKKIIVDNDNIIREEITNDFVLYYVWDRETDTAHLRVDMVNNNVVSVLIGVGMCYNELTDKVNREELFYFIKKDGKVAVTTDYNQVKNAIGYVEPISDYEPPVTVREIEN